MELTNVTVDLGVRRLDVCVPGGAPVAELLPELLRHGSVATAGEGTGWELRLLDGRRLAAGRGLDEQGVTDGSVLYLVPSTVDWPDWECDDVAETAAAAAGGTSRAWAPEHTRAAALAVAVACLVAGLAVGVRTAAPAGALAAALLLGFAGTAAARLRRDASRTARHGGLDPGPTHGVGPDARPDVRDGGRTALPGPDVTPVLLGCGAAYAFAGGALLIPGGAGRLLLGSAVLLLYAALGWAGVPDSYGSSAAAAVVGVAGLIGAGLAGVLEPAAAAAAVSCAAVLGTSAMPALAVRLGGLPVPVPGAATPDGAAVRRAVARGDGSLAGLLTGMAVVAAAATWTLSGTPGPWVVAYLAACGTVLVLRARAMVAVRHRLPVLAAGLAGYGSAARALLPGHAPAGGVALPVLVTAGLLLAAVGSRRDGRVVSPYLGRALDLTDTAATVTLVPLACAAIGLYGRVAALVS